MAGNRALCDAVLAEDIPVIKQLLADGCRPSTYDQYGMNAYTYCCRFSADTRYPNIVSLLEGAELIMYNKTFQPKYVWAKDDMPRSTEYPLLVACAEFDYDMVSRILCDTPAQANLATPDGLTPVAFAVCSERRILFEILMFRHELFDFNVRWLGDPLVHHACASTSNMLSELIRIAGDRIDYTAFGRHGHTPLGVACWHGDITVISMLSKIAPDKLDPNIPGDNTPLRIACEQGRPGCARALARLFGPRIRLNDPLHPTPLRLLQTHSFLSAEIMRELCGTTRQFCFDVPANQLALGAILTSGQTELQLAVFECGASVANCVRRDDNSTMSVWDMVANQHNVDPRIVQLVHTQMEWIILYLSVCMKRKRLFLPAEIVDMIWHDWIAFDCECCTNR